jgi:hypothetical protein
MYLVLDRLLGVVHGALIVFVLTGWALRQARRIHLALTLVLFVSWFGLGLVYGVGYCPLTDWHWQVKRRLGERNLPLSFVEYHADRWTGIDWSPRVVDGVVLGAAIGSLGLSVWGNLRDRRRARQEA